MGLSTGPCAGRPGSGLSGSAFSGPHDCVDLVNSLQVVEKQQKILAFESAWIGVAIWPGATGIEASQVIAGTVLCFWNSLTDISFRQKRAADEPQADMPDHEKSSAPRHSAPSRRPSTASHCGAPGRPSGARVAACRRPARMVETAGISHLDLILPW